MKWTTPELTRARELIEVVGLPSGSVAKMLHHEFGTIRTPGAVRDVLRKYYGWHGTQRGPRPDPKRDTMQETESTHRGRVT